MGKLIIFPQDRRMAHEDNKENEGHSNQQETGNAFSIDKPWDLMGRGMPIADIHEKIEDHITSYFRHIQSSTLEAMEDYPDFISRLMKLDKAKQEHFGIQDELNPDITGVILNRVGIGYNFIGRSKRETVLESTLDFLDSLSYDTADQNVLSLEAPYLPADIIINRKRFNVTEDECPPFSLYDIYKDIVIGNRSWGRFYNLSVAFDFENNFLLAYFVMQKELSSFDVRMNYLKHYRSSVNQASHAIAAIMYNSFNPLDCKTLDDHLSYSLKKFDPVFHPGIEKKLREQEWIRL